MEKLCWNFGIEFIGQTEPNLSLTKFRTEEYFVKGRSTWNEVQQCQIWSLQLEILNLYS